MYPALGDSCNACSVGRIYLKWPFAKDNDPAACGCKRVAPRELQSSTLCRAEEGPLKFDNEQRVCKTR
ncbi:hypothetical protein PAXRUDRAFT_821762 [Paxillus rubicundulus Ve08.2h10]|uniref:Uncharacterized protein n=1 Tax=Paxillus rubicundulus Ve08.2h10 TaxID=930991 RepID=A0A0D0DXR4_9AGAM|nr:hypothetical protein PAXRUDRAFT_821762 [Paxillus rubicundulus Ve08.2h10]